jgi:hypothetical protein
MNKMRPVHPAFSQEMQDFQARLEKFPDIVGPGERWEKGIPHRQDTVALFEEIQSFDFLYMDDYFSWREGGDGDNGETFMYELDVIFELRELENKIRIFG